MAQAFEKTGSDQRMGRIAREQGNAPRRAFKK